MEGSSLPVDVPAWRRHTHADGWLAARSVGLMLVVLAPAAIDSLGRALAVTEALTGQIYLVTVVALIIANIGRGASRRPA